MKNYIIRVYRQDREDPNKVVGIVENVDEDKQNSFTSLGELMRILCSQEKIVSEITTEELEEVIRSGVNRGANTGTNFNLRDLWKSGKEEGES